MDEYDTIMSECLKSDKIKKDYDDYIIKDITFKEFVQGHVDDLCFIYLNAKRKEMKNDD